MGIEHTSATCRSDALPLSYRPTPRAPDRQAADVGSISTRLMYLTKHFLNDIVIYMFQHVRRKFAPEEKFLGKISTILLMDILENFFPCKFIS